MYVKLLVYITQAAACGEMSRVYVKSDLGIASRTICTRLRKAAVVPPVLSGLVKSGKNYVEPIAPPSQPNSAGNGDILGDQTAKKDDGDDDQYSTEAAAAGTLSYLVRVITSNSDG